MPISRVSPVFFMIRVPPVFVPVPVSVPVVTAVMSLFPLLPMPVLSRVFGLVSVPAPASTPAATPALASAPAPSSTPAPGLVPLSLIVLALVPVPPIVVSVILSEGIRQWPGLPVPQLRALITLVQGWWIQHGGIGESWGCI